MVNAKIPQPDDHHHLFTHHVLLQIYVNIQVKNTIIKNLHAKKTES